MNATQYIAFKDELKKIAGLMTATEQMASEALPTVTLKQLQQATKFLKPIRGRRIDLARGFVHSKATGPTVSPAFSIMHPKPKAVESIRHAIRKSMKSGPSSHLADMMAAGKAKETVKRIKALKPGIYQSGSSYKAVKDTFDKIKKDHPVLTRGRLSRIPNLKKPESREMFNRSVMLHEVAEASKHPGRHRFFSHHSLRPPLQDLNIASTLTGPGGKEAATALRRMRSQELELLYREFPSLRRLRIGKQRMSRHAIKRVQQIFDRKASADLPRESRFAIATRGPSTSSELAKPVVERWAKKQKFAPLPPKTNIAARLQRIAATRGFRNKLKELGSATLGAAKKSGSRTLALRQRQRQLLEWVKSRWGLSNAEAQQLVGSWSKHLG